MSDNYQRLFFIFKNMDIVEGKPSGYLKIENNAGVAKLQLSISSLQERRGWEYRLFAIKKTGEQLLYTNICPIPILNNRADVKFSAQSNSLGSNGLNVDDINIYAILLQNKDREENFLCPLVAYAHEEVTWKEKLAEQFAVKENIPSEVVSVQPLLVTPEDNAVNEAPETDHLVTPEEMEADYPLEQEPEELPDQLLDETGDTESTDESIGSEQDGTIPFNEDAEPAGEVTEGESEDNTWLDVESRLRAEEQTGEPADWSYIVSSESGILEASERDYNDILTFSSNGSVSNLREELDNSFEKYNPFKMKSKNFHWWKINSPGFLNNILFRNSIKSYLLFNPKVMLAHYKYRYIIFGIRSMRRTGREQLVCGVPGVYSIDENPFGSMGSWVQLEGYKPKYGAFGYWIVMIDPRTGKLVKIK